MKDKLKLLDVFCGAGGFSQGFFQAGFNIVAGIDNNIDCLETFRNNFPTVVTAMIDLSKKDFLDKLVKKLSNKKIDVVIGGPPCQGFSIAGKRQISDPRNELYRSFIQIIELMLPRAIVLENVPTILSLYKGVIAEAVIKDLNKLGYIVNCFTLNASHYGIPQNRKRTFFVALRKSHYVIPAPHTVFSPISTEMAISDLPLLEDNLGAEVLEYIEPPRNVYQKRVRENSNFIYNHCAVQHTNKTKKIISLVPDGGNYKSLPKYLQSTRRVNIAWTRMNSTKPCFTIDAGHNHHFHYKANRVPTVRECGRIQSFPDTFRFYGNKTSQFKQVGNAVPPLLSYEIAKKLIESIL